MIRNEYMQENPRINRTDRRSRSVDLLTPRRSPSSALPLHTHRSSALPEGPLGGLPSLSLTTKCSWIHLLWEGHQASRQLSDASTPPPTNHPASSIDALRISWVRARLSNNTYVILKLRDPTPSQFNSPGHSSLSSAISESDNNALQYY